MAISECLHKFQRFGILCLAGLAVLSGAADVLAQGLLGAGKVIYDGKPANRSGITIGSWGGGVCKEATRNTYGGERSIEVVSKGLYEGGRIDFNAPVDITKEFGNPNAYLQLVASFGGADATSGFEWAADPMYSTAATGKSVTRMRLVLYLEDGSALEQQVNMAGFKPDGDGWTNVSFPLSALKGKLNLPEHKIKRIVIAGDTAQTFYIGAIRIIEDRSLIEADAGEEQEIARNDNVRFQGSSNAGAAAVKYSWDFDSTDGIQEDAVGIIVYHRFRTAGTYTVTLTVSDVFGIKKPGTSTVRIKVNE